MALSNEVWSEIRNGTPNGYSESREWVYFLEQPTDVPVPNSPINRWD